MTGTIRRHRARRSPGHDYHGHATRRLASEHLWVDVLATAGPRIVRLGLAGSTRNLLAETPDLGWETPHGRYELFGGHRLWFAPEDPDRVAVPDGHGLAVDAEPGGIRLTGLAEPPTGLVRSMTLRLLEPAGRARGVPRAAATSPTGRSSSRPGRSPSCRSGGPCSCRSRRRRPVTTSIRTGRWSCGRTRAGRIRASGHGTAC